MRVQHRNERTGPGDRRWSAAPVVFALWAAVAAALPAAVPVQAQSQAQVTRADTAAVLLDVARTFEAEGRLDLAEELLELLVERYGDTPAGTAGVDVRASVRDTRRQGRGQAGYVVWSTIFGAWMGIALPAAFGADEPEPFGAGLLVGAPAGFFASRAYGQSTGMTVGTSRTITFSWMWGTWQAVGWRNVLDLGESDACFPDGGCVPTDDGQDNWTAIVVGGLGGYAAGIAATRAFDVDAGTAEMLWHGSLWGTAYGYALGFVLAEQEGDELWATALLAGNAGLLASIPASMAWQPTSGQVRIVTAAGLTGAVVGLGVDLLATPDDERWAVAIPTIGATIGLVGGALITANDDPGPTPEEERGGFQTSLLRLDRGLRLGLPAPVPVMRGRLLPDGTTHLDPGVELTLLRAAF